MRQAWVMKLKPGMEAEYKRRHDEIWPELADLIREQGIRTYSIYRYGLILFAYLERDEAPDPKASIEQVVWQWWEYMAPLMETNADFSPVQEPVDEMFHIGATQT